MKSIIYPILLVLVLSGCTTHNYVFKGKGPDHPIGNIDPDLRKTNHFFFWGFMQTKTVDIVYLCDRGDNTVLIKDYKNLWDIIFTSASLGFYTPTTTDIYCRY
ncbi:MAG: hypothetical protein OXE99_10440 [Cellvibrionales bacterium]|nr:hypothetical protein [Cellvibrionales bacterium]